MPKIACTGSKGAVGSELVRRGCIPIEFDITFPTWIKDEIYTINPDVVIHCAAITDVSYCESHFQESFDVNVRGTVNIVNAMPKGSLLVYISSDHVFSGNQYFNNGYGERQKPSPVNRYGFSKWGAEEMVKTSTNPYVIVRSSKLFNYPWAQPTLDKFKEGERIEETDIIKRSFLHINHFVDGLFKLVEIYKEGLIEKNLINISGSSVYSYYLFWMVMQKELGLPGKLIPRMHELKDADPRPFRGGLCIDRAKKLGIPIYTIVDGAKLLAQGI